MTANPAGAGPDAAADLVALRSRAGTAVIAATVLASTVGFIDAYMINVAIPAIGRDLQASVSELQWVLTGYLITVASLLLLAGALADHFGRRATLVAGLVVMLVASVCCALAPNPAVLIVGRLIQGAGGALVVPSSLALLNGTLRARDRARGIGVWAGISTLGTTLGLLAAGILGLASLAALVPAEQRLRRPMLRTTLFRSRPFDAINAATLLFYGALGAVSYLVDAVSRIGGVVLIALVPALIGASGSAGGLAGPLAAHYRSAMLVMAGVTVAAAVLTAVFVPSRRATAPHPAPAPRLTACAVAEPA